jgi:transglutaminase-like putative cysteine protease
MALPVAARPAWVSRGVRVHPLQTRRKVTMKLALQTAQIAGAAAGAIGLGWYVFALPAMRSLPAGLRPDLEAMTIEEAAARLRRCGADGWPLIESARQLVGGRVQYCRRNSLESHRTAFRRGYGFCQQQAYALVDLLRQLGFEAQPVYALRCRFPGNLLSGHTWVRVTHAGVTRDIDGQNMDAAGEVLTFEPLTPVRTMGPLFCAFSAWGSAGVNAYRYYRTGRDKD